MAAIKVPENSRDRLAAGWLAALREHTEELALKAQQGDERARTALDGKDKLAVVYLLTGPEPSDRYVGSTTGSARRRFTCHLLHSFKKNSPLMRRMVETGVLPGKGCVARADAIWTTTVLERVPAAFARVHELKHQLELETLSFGAQLAGADCANSRGRYDGGVGLNKNLAYRLCVTSQDRTMRKYYRKKTTCPHCGKVGGTHSASKHRALCQKSKKAVLVEGGGPKAEGREVVLDTLLVGSGHKADPSGQLTAD